MLQFSLRPSFFINMFLFLNRHSAFVTLPTSRPHLAGDVPNVFHLLSPSLPPKANRSTQMNLHECTQHSLTGLDDCIVIMCNSGTTDDYSVALSKMCLSTPALLRMVQSSCLWLLVNSYSCNSTCLGLAAVALHTWILCSIKEKACIMLFYHDSHSEVYIKCK